MSKIKILKKELTVKLSDLIGCIESVETHHNGDQDEIREMYKTDLFHTMGFIISSGNSTIEDLKEQLEMVDNYRGF